MINSTDTIILIPFARNISRAVITARMAWVAASSTLFGPRALLGLGGFPEMIPPRARLTVNNSNPCQSPGRGRPH